ncbi:hypothetical protein HYPSUDRAFT_1006337 [Hypholoma sublateritium FD-334 SS-4]|uniref:Peptidase C14 caspase domain-containing protein n=1 Tax=Hypholoma sublateritium (strain FD-334 SS-4) TaxID=945553 RepID=A0A0D2M3J8_HYPSF|nr:hypothetical protein HYPSUDRAFT_1006337 [Hypholoma sublateritium FD-334 SS-4]
MSRVSSTRRSTGRLDFVLLAGRKSSSLLSYQAESEAGGTVHRRSSRRRSSSSFKAAWVVIPSPAPERSYTDLGAVREDGGAVLPMQCLQDLPSRSFTGDSAASALAQEPYVLTESPKQMATELPELASEGSADAVSVKDAGDAEPRVATTYSHMRHTNTSGGSNISTGRRTPKRKALLIGVQKIREPNSPTPKEPAEELVSGVMDAGGTPRGSNSTKKRKKKDVVGAHRDVEGMRKLLIKVYHYDADDITVLIDNDELGHVQPTKDVIRLATLPGMCVQEISCSSFVVAGHGGQEDSDPDDVHPEEDEKDEFIITSDGDKIKDNELRKRLVDDLPIGSSLNAFFDCCHSGTLLDLFHHRCNRVWVPWCNKGTRRTRSHWEIIRRKVACEQLSVFDAVKFLEKLSRPDAPSGAAVDMMKSIRSTLDTTMESNGSEPPVNAHGENSAFESDIIYGDLSNKDLRRAQVMSPEPMFCDGFCRGNGHFRMDDSGRLTAKVICLSSSKDAQMTWEDGKGNSMTQHLIKILKKNPNPTYKKLLTDVSHAIHGMYTGLHTKARAYKKDAARYKETHKEFEIHPAEMHNFQNPQISSHYPLDMSLTFSP